MEEDLFLNFSPSGRKEVGESGVRSHKGRRFLDYLCWFLAGKENARIVNPPGGKKRGEERSKLKGVLLRLALGKKTSLLYRRDV